MSNKWGELGAGLRNPRRERVCALERRPELSPLEAPPVGGRPNEPLSAESPDRGRHRPADDFRSAHSIAC